MFVYTFWEPRDSIPYYLRLCMATWKKFLPNATVVVLDYKNIGDFIDVRELGLDLFSGRFSLMHISDALRVVLLAKRGGVWLDADTIILNHDAEKFFLPDKKHRTIFFGDPKDKGCYTAFVNAPPDAMCMKFWLEGMREKLWNLNAATVVDWDFFSNAFINDYAKNFADEIKIFDNRRVMPELKSSTGHVTDEALYKDFYFLKNFHSADVATEMLLLHNSWTPKIFKTLNAQNFWTIDCTLVNILAEALEVSLPESRRRVVAKTT